MSKTTQTVFGGPPRVELLPPEVGQRKKQRATRRRLILLLIAAIVIVAVGYGFATVRALGAQAELAVAQQRTQELLAQQQQYAEATRVSAALQTASTARAIGSSTEILWNDLYNDVKATLPDGALLSAFSVTGRAPWQPALVPAGPLRQPKVASMTFEVVTTGPLDVEALFSKLQKVPGFADATPDVQLLDKAELGLYKTTFTVNLNEEALANRYPIDETGAN